MRNIKPPEASLKIFYKIRSNSFFFPKIILILMYDSVLQSTKQPLRDRCLTNRKDEPLFSSKWTQADQDTAATPGSDVCRAPILHGLLPRLCGMGTCPCVLMGIYLLLFAEARILYCP